MDVGLYFSHLRLTTAPLPGVSIPIILERRYSRPRGDLAKPADVARQDAADVGSTAGDLCLRQAVLRPA